MAWNLISEDKNTLQGGAEQNRGWDAPKKQVCDHFWTVQGPYWGLFLNLPGYIYDLLGDLSL